MQIGLAKLQCVGNRVERLIGAVLPRSSPLLPPYVPSAAFVICFTFASPPFSCVLSCVRFATASPTYSSISPRKAVLGTRSCTFKVCIGEVGSLWCSSTQRVMFSRSNDCPVLVTSVGCVIRLWLIGHLNCAGMLSSNTFPSLSSKRPNGIGRGTGQCRAAILAIYAYGSTRMAVRVEEYV